MDGNDILTKKEEGFNTLCKYNTVFTVGRNMFSLIMNAETCFTMKIVHIRRCIARIVIKTCLF